MDHLLRRLERKIASGDASPMDIERFTKMQCVAFGHQWAEGWDNTVKSTRGPVEYKGSYFHCTRCDPDADRRIYDVDELGDINI